MSRAKVSFRAKEARVTFDPSQVSVDQLIEAVKKAGFRASATSGARENTQTPHAVAQTSKR